MEGPFERLNNAGLTKVKAEDLAIFVKLKNDHEGKLELLNHLFLVLQLFDPPKNTLVPQKILWSPRPGRQGL